MDAYHVQSRCGEYAMLAGGTAEGETASRRASGVWVLIETSIQGMSEIALIVALGLGRKSSIGLPHSKTWRRHFDPRRRASVLECGSPLPLFNRLGETLAPPTSWLFTHHASHITHHA